MKPTAAVISFLLLLAAAYWAFEGSMPAYRAGSGQAATSFSTDRALEHVKAVSREPHGVGFPGHARVREYILNTLEEMGLETSLQTGYTAGDWGNLSKAINILARVPGRKPGKALLLLAHYDSSPHSSLGAGDDGSGVAVILEGMRAFLASGHQPENDIIILISDAEELGLNGADLFVNAHPWAADVGLVLNFEARGSGGPGIMLIETNGGNSGLIQAFTAAGPEYPVANSLMYSIYKMLPNDTDLTVFREDGDIDGFNFAFIDDHYDYHTALDSYERLDRRTLAHQGSYLVPLLEYFSTTSLDGLRSREDLIYFNLPFFKLVSYPFAWNWPLLGGAVILFVLILISGFKKGRLSLGGIGRGTIPMLFSLLLCGLTGYFAWPLLLRLYPAYADMLHGFTYNGYLYIAAWVSLAFGCCFWVYGRFRNLRPADALVAPGILWLILCGLLNAYLPGAAFFLLPGITLLMALFITTWQERPDPWALSLLGIPVLWTFAPMVRLFPVGLGLRMMIAASLMSCFIFLLMLGIWMQYPKKRKLGWLGILLFFGFMAGAHWTSGFTAADPKPSSLLYVTDADSGKTYWATYDKVPVEWTRAYLGDDPGTPGSLGLNTLSSKYNSGFSFVAEAPSKPISQPEIRVESDTVAGDLHRVAFTVYPRRPVNRLEIFTGEGPLNRARVNGIALTEHYLENRRGGKLITHYISDNDSTRVELEFPAGEAMELTLYEASNDLLQNPLFSVPPRPEGVMPMPFVLNDAVLLIQKIRFE